MYYVLHVLQRSLPFHGCDISFITTEISKGCIQLALENSGCWLKIHFIACKAVKSWISAFLYEGNVTLNTGKHE